MSMNKLPIALLLLAAAAAVAAPAAPQTAPGAAAPVKQAAPASEVRVLIKAAREARIASGMSGRVASLPVKMGANFSKGDLLVGFECDHQQAQLAAAEANRTKMQKNLDSRRALLVHQAVSDLDVQLSEADLATATAQVDGARASVRDCRVLAPYNGSMVRVMVNQWETVPAGTPLVEIVERGQLVVEAHVQSRWLTWLRKGQRFEIQVDELGVPVPAEVTGIGARVDPVSQTVGISARILDVPAGLRPGMSGNARFTPPAK
jgi:RND family efflux transporter MFP subunit